MKFYFLLLAIALTAASTMPSLASFKGNPPQKIVVAEQITLSAKKVNPPPSPAPNPTAEPETMPYRGIGRR